jgi:hypothetical protein
VVDTWTDDRHKKGGIGFFSERGEEALLSWVRISDADGLFAKLPMFYSFWVNPAEFPLPGDGDSR